MGVFHLLKYLLPVVVAFLFPATDTLDHRRVGNGTHRHGLLQEPMESASVIKCWRSELKCQLSRYLRPILTLAHLWR